MAENRKRDEAELKRDSSRLLNTTKTVFNIPKQFVVVAGAVALGAFVVGGLIAALVIGVPLGIFLHTIHAEDPFALISLIERLKHSSPMLAGETEKRRLILLK